MADSVAATSPESGLELRRMGGATLLMMAAILASRLVGFLRTEYVAWAFGAGHATDAFMAAFTIPDWLNYLVAGGSLSISFQPIFSGCVERREWARGYRAFSVIATFMAAVLMVGVGLGEWLAPFLLRQYVSQFGAAQMAYCVSMTRILLPAQLLFCLSGLLTAMLYARGMFLLPALAPIAYNICIILGGVLLGHWMGIAGMAVGAVVGAAALFALPLLGNLKTGLKFRPSFDWRNPELRRWFALTLPLMLGVSLVSADTWIMNHFAAGVRGAISHLTYAKMLVGVPVAILGQAVGQASLPFFTRLAVLQRWDAFRETVDRAVVRTVTLALLATSLFTALAAPLVRLLFRHGRFDAADSRLTATYFAIFAVSLVGWTSQSLYSRAFYATGNTLTPMTKSTLVTVAMIPIYWWMSAHWGVMGLAVASDVGILTHTLVLAWLLRRRQLLSFARQRWREVPKAVLVAAAAGTAAYCAAGAVGNGPDRLLTSLGRLGAGGGAWLAVAAATAWWLRARQLLEDVAGWSRRLLPAKLAGR